MSLSPTDKDIIRKHFTVPAHVHACASAIRYDLLFGPSWSLIPKEGIEKFTEDHFATYPGDLEDEKGEGKITETYTSIVANTLADYIGELPSELWYDKFAGSVEGKEPEALLDDEEWIEPNWEDYYKLDQSDIVEILFGKTIAKEFK